MTIPIEAIYVAAVLSAIYFIGKFVFAKFAKVFNQFTTDIRALTISLNSLAKGNVYLAGQAKVSEAMVAEVGKLREAVSKFTGIIAPGAVADESEDAVGMPNWRQAEVSVAQATRDAARILRQQELQAGGLSADEAAVAAENEDGFEPVSL